ncbi:hypothetical protein CJU94_05745 [Paraburkholderia aromaticivorans]|uniref:Uncharacterized protein n=1 Tax=Paraburkholderia aromaticivorans TaxID=2026199 RepID=A0A248VFQ5_9BURK|nr:hypothetical protein CJU94_05745 [Paraburkholderia aromaticivorans]
MYGIPQKAAARWFRALPGKVLNKVIHRHAGRLQLFSGIQNLARKLKFYFNFGMSADHAPGTTMRRPVAPAILIAGHA